MRGYKKKTNYAKTVIYHEIIRINNVSIMLKAIWTAMWECNNSGSNTRVVH